MVSWISCSGTDPLVIGFIGVEWLLGLISLAEKHEKKGAAGSDLPQNFNRNGDTDTRGLGEGDGCSSGQ